MRCVKCRAGFRREEGCRQHTFDDLTGVCVDCGTDVFRPRAVCIHRTIVVRPRNVWRAVCSL